MNVTIIPRAKDLIDEVFDSLIPSGLDYSSNLVLFPGKRPAHFLRKRIAKEVNQSFIPPRIFSMDSFIDRVFDESVSAGNKKIEALDAVAILYEINKNCNAPLGGGSFLKPDLFFPLGIKLFSDLEELLIEDVPVAKVREVDFESFEESITGDMKDRLDSLSGFYETFYKYLSEHNLSTRATRYSRVSRLPDIGSLADSERIIGAGFFALTGAENRLMRELLKKKQTLLVFQDGPGIKRAVEKLGSSFQITREKSHDTGARPRYHFIKSPDTHGQVLALNHTLAALGEQKVSGESIFIMLPAPETLFPLINHTLSTIGSYNISLGFPLKRTPVYGFFSNLMDLLSSMDKGRVYVPHYLKFILHPYTKNIYFNRSPELTRVIFHSLERELTKNRSKLFMPLKEIEGFEPGGLETLSGNGVPGRETLAKHLKTIHENTIHLFADISNTGDFAEKGIRLLSYIYEESTASLHPFFHPFCENFIQALMTISRSMAKDISFDSLLSYFHFVKSYLNTCHTPFEGVPLKGVQVTGFLETRNLKADRVFILDMNEGVLPENRKDNSLIPFKVRKYIGLPTYSDREKISSYYFETITGGAKEVFLYFIESKQMEKSRFVAKLVWDEEKLRGDKKGHGLVKSVHYRCSLDRERVDPVFKDEGMVTFLRKFNFSATSLDAYLYCPLRFYYSYVLNVRESEALPEVIESSQVGLFIHKVLQVLLEKKRGVTLTEELFSVSEMESTVDRLFAEQFSSRISGSLYILKSQIKRQLKNFFIKYQIPQILVTPTIVTDVELRLQTAFNGYLIKGVVDRVERRDGIHTIIDYKSSSNPAFYKCDLKKIDPDERGTWESGIGSIQLPFYALLYSLVEKVRVESIEGKILLLGKNVIDAGIEVSLFSGTAPKADQFKVYTGVISGLLDEITDQSIPFYPPEERMGKCPECKYARICGV